MALDRLKMLVGEQEFNHVEASVAAPQDVVPPVTNGAWVAVNEEKGMSSDEADRNKNLQSTRRSRKPEEKTPEPLPDGVVKNMAYKFRVNTSHQKFSEAKSRFFVDNKFWKRGWTLYYICSRFASQPLIFVPAVEVWNFLGKINTELDVNWTIDKPENESGFLISFPNDGLPRPRYLGKVEVKAVFDDYQIQLRAAVKDHDAVEDPVEAEVVSRGVERKDPATEAFRKKIEMANALSKQDFMSTKTKKAKQRQEAKEAWCRQLRRAQRYLGLRPANIAEEKGATTRQYKSWDEEEAVLVALDQLRQEGTPVVDVHQVAPHSCDHDVVFVCVDVEAYEENHSLITEIGISSLDTRTLSGVTPGPHGRAWMDMINARHFRIRENDYLVNRKHIIGCPDKFLEEFGKSEWISINNAAEIVASCFRPPFGAKREASSLDLDEASRRSIVLVGHNISADVDFLRRVGYDVKNLSNLLEVLDTADLYRALKHETQPTSLGTVVSNVGIDAWHLHNAGNDAAYTLQAMIGVAIKGVATSEVRSTETKEDRVRVAQARAAKEVHDDWEEWKAASEKGEDGGEPVPFIG